MQKCVFDYFVNEINIENNIKLHIRSVFMQGLLLTNDIGKYNLNNNLKKFHQKWMNFVKETKLSSKVICIDFIKKINAEYVIIGIDKKRHLEEFITILNKNTNIAVPDFKSPLNVNDARYWVQ